ncbi:MAG: hypothetical protein IPK15_10540 [Verrucomicrobia bacterium]|nr:hypothetical protein [Verrucomicrobiota bacterium]
MQSIDAKSLSEKQRLALISLLADDDPAVYNLIRSKLLSYGSDAEEWLQSELLSSNPTMRRRAREIIFHRTRERAHDAFTNYCTRQGEDLDLEEATLLLARTRFPEINVDAYSALFDAWAQEIGDRFAKSSSAASYLDVFNQYLFRELGFGGHENYGTDPESCYINTIVDKRCGNPIGLCAIYLFMARRTGLPVTGIALPGHFICRYQSAQAETYIDCFRRGAVLTKADCVKYLLQTGQGLLEGQLAPVSSRRILQRMCRNLVTTYGHLEETDEAGRAQQYLDALDD